MKTIKDYKSLLRTQSLKDEKNSVLGMHLNSLFSLDINKDARIHNLEEKIEVIVLINNLYDVNLFTDEFKLGTISKGYYQWKLNQYSDF